MSCPHEIVLCTRWRSIEDNRLFEVCEIVRAGNDRIMTVKIEAMTPAGAYRWPIQMRQLDERELRDGFRYVGEYY